MELFHLASESLDYHCPFNVSHSMPQKRFIKHITKCPDRPSNFKTCVYNVSHVMADVELKEHEDHCPNRILFDSTVYESEDLVRPDLMLTKNSPNIDYEESWDGLEHTADVLKNIKKSTIKMKAKHNSTKSERKLYRNTLHSDTDITIPVPQSLKTSRAKNLQRGLEENIKLKPSKTKQLFIGKRPIV